MKHTTAYLLGVEDDDLQGLLVRLLGDMEIDVSCEADRSVVDLVLTYAKPGRVVDALLLAAQQAGAAAILLVVGVHEEDLRSSAKALGAHGYHALDGNAGDLRVNVERALRLARTGARR